MVVVDPPQGAVLDRKLDEVLVEFVVEVVVVVAHFLHRQDLDVAEDFEDFEGGAVFRVVLDSLGWVNLFGLLDILGARDP